MLKLLIMAVAQGLTEFLPVSSSGHLALMKHFLGVDSPGATLEVALHTGTLVSILAYYHRRIGLLAKGLFRRNDGSWSYAFDLVLASVPALAVYVIAGDRIEALFDIPAVSGGMLCVTGILLLSLAVRRKGAEEDSTPAESGVGRGRALAIGLGQALAMVPGISRSGSTIAVARHLGISPRRAAEFSLLMAVPALTVAGALKWKALIENGGAAGLSAGSLILGAVVSALVGYCAIIILVRSLASGRFWIFGIYCVLAGLASLGALAAGF